MSSGMFVDTETGGQVGGDPHGNLSHLPNSVQGANRVIGGQCNMVARLNNRMNGARDNHASKEATYYASMDAINAKSAQETQQLRQQYLNNSTAGTGTKSKASKANGGGRGNKRSNAAAAAAAAAASASGASNANDSDGHTTKASKVPKLTPKQQQQQASIYSSSSPATTPMSVVSNLASSSPSPSCNVGDFKQSNGINGSVSVDVKPNIATVSLSQQHPNGMLLSTTTNSSPNNSRPPPSSSSTHSRASMPEIKREVIDSNIHHIEELNAAYLQDYFIGGSGVNSTNSSTATNAIGYDMDPLGLGHDTLKGEVSFDVSHMDNITEEFVDEEFIKKLFEDLSRENNSLMHSNSMMGPGLPDGNPNHLQLQKGPLNHDAHPPQTPGMLNKSQNTHQQQQQLMNRIPAQSSVPNNVNGGMCYHSSNGSHQRQQQVQHQTQQQFQQQQVRPSSAGSLLVQLQQRQYDQSTYPPPQAGQIQQPQAGQQQQPLVGQQQQPLVGQQQQPQVGQQQQPQYINSNIWQQGPPRQRPPGPPLPQHQPQHLMQQQQQASILNQSPMQQQRQCDQSTYPPPQTQPHGCQQQQSQYINSNTWQQGPQGQRPPGPPLPPQQPQLLMQQQQQSSFPNQSPMQQSQQQQQQQQQQKHYYYNGNNSYYFQRTN